MGELVTPSENQLVRNDKVPKSGYVKRPRAWEREHGKRQPMTRIYMCGRQALSQADILKNAVELYLSLRYCPKKPRHHLPELLARPFNVSVSPERTELA